MPTKVDFLKDEKQKKKVNSHHEIENLFIGDCCTFIKTKSLKLKKKKKIHFL
jgi:hypothetical protein